MAKHINLLIPELAPRFDPLALNHVLIAAVSGTLLICGLSAHSAWQLQQSTSQQHKAEKHLAELQEALAETGQALVQRSPSAVLERQVATIRQELKTRAQALRAVGLSTVSASSENLSYSAILDALARQTMDGLWLTGIDIIGKDIEIRGRMRDHTLLPLYLQKLNAEAAFQQFRFSALAMNGITPAADAPPAGAKKTAPAIETPFVEFSLRTSEKPLLAPASTREKLSTTSAGTDETRLPAVLGTLLSELEALRPAPPRSESK